MKNENSYGYQFVVSNKLSDNTIRKLNRYITEDLFSDLSSNDRPDIVESVQHVSNWQSASGQKQTSGSFETSR